MRLDNKYEQMGLLYLYRLGNVHLVDFYVRETASWHLFEVVVVAVK